MAFNDSPGTGESLSCSKSPEKSNPYKWLATTATTIRDVHKAEEQDLVIMHAYVDDNGIEVGEERFASTRQRLHYYINVIKSNARALNFNS